MSKILKEIEETITQLVHLERVESQLQSTKAELSDASEQLSLLHDQIDHELANLEKLEGLSTRSIFYKVLGSKEEQIEKERQEYLELSLKQDGLVNSMKILDYEIKLLESKLAGQSGLKSQLEQLKIKREKEILETDPVLKAQLIDLNEKLEANIRLKKELQEAIEVGVNCVNTSSRILQELQGVTNSGSWGHPPRNRQQTRYARRDSIDRARSLSAQLRHDLHLFEKELQDVGKNVNVRWDEKNMNNFTEFFFDNLITDWILKQQLTQTIGAVSQTLAELNEHLRTLKERIEKCNTDIAGFKQKREAIITQ